MPNLFKSLYFQVLVAIAIGIALDNFYPSFAIQLKPLGNGFIKLIKMMIAPIIFCTIVSGQYHWQYGCHHCCCKMGEGN